MGVPAAIARTEMGTMQGKQWFVVIVTRNTHWQHGDEKWGCFSLIVQCWKPFRTSQHAADDDCVHNLVLHGGGAGAGLQVRHAPPICKQLQLVEMRTVRFALCDDDTCVLHGASALGCIQTHHRWSRIHQIWYPGTRPWQCAGMLTLPEKPCSLAQEELWWRNKTGKG